MGAQSTAMSTLFKLQMAMLVSLSRKFLAPILYSRRKRLLDKWMDKCIKLFHLVNHTVLIVSM